MLLLIIAAGVLGWTLGHSDNSKPSNQSPEVAQPVPEDTANAPSVKSLVSYTLPDGWKEFGCSRMPSTAYVIPSGSSELNCDADPSAPVRISVDTGSHTDCNQLQNVQDVKKHVCISLYINGYKSLKASTEYLASSSYKKSTTVNAYYVNTGQGVIKLEYIYNSDNQYQKGFDQLSNSIRLKS